MWRDRSVEEEGGPNIHPPAAPLGAEKCASEGEKGARGSAEGGKACGSVYFVRGPSEHGTPTFPLPPLFSKVLSIQ